MTVPDELLPRSYASAREPFTAAAQTGGNYTSRKATRAQDASNQVAERIGVV
jgi:hypothetical protein